MDNPGVGSINNIIIFDNIASAVAVSLYLVDFYLSLFTAKDKYIRICCIRILSDVFRT